MSSATILAKLLNRPAKNSMNDYTEVFTNRLTVNFMRKMVHRVGACIGNTDANPCIYEWAVFSRREHRDSVLN